MAEFFLNYDSSKAIQNEMAKVPDRAEDAVNKVLHTYGAKQAIQQIVKFMPMSNRNKKHAKNSNPLKSDMMNLGFRVYARGGAAKNKGSFGYLVFPNDGIGPHNLIDQRFFEQGGEAASNPIFRKVMEALEDAMKL
ncbi:hypothetical protein C5L30_000236 [Companilactobacillus farciminis]|jgi:aspartate aminotransferase-like enzyme|uniref:HK97 gp10 family phage protein n=1 Tax=Companilactobacillus farciminis TaxID=1612 RepID=A0A4R5NJQ5_9LACO|nr:MULTISPECIES: hypothetical protein [Companilactobacillus]ATO46109.1 hypothetical protein LF20184_04795 [Companilactobacillus farciminis KCTC 3681 = DSM 20184]KRK62494.1 hypothetical protein FC68_GL002024 [Companilactobacillus farciminis KCTC 3681 = DSM 20184]TDG74520.1 hypothetical protein C5L30_000236 [Companilactobacillus farciminis]HJF88178.1 hypothetical protein [Companilactobacillus farciminis]